MNYQRSILLASACACVLAAASAADAQDSAKKQSTVGASILEEIVVTAQKRSENLQEVPIAVTALTSETRDLVGIVTLEDITNFTPGLTYEGQLDRANIRGVGRVTNQPGTDPGVALYVNGVYNSSTTSAARNSIFMDRVEVLRGPQSTLYGRNTTGGAINTVAKAPKDALGGEARLTYGNYDRKIFAGSVTGPITDWLRFRVTAAATKQDEGYFRNLAPPPAASTEGGVQNDRDYEAVLAANFGKNVELSFRYGHQEQYSLARYSANFTQPAYSAASSTALFGVSATTGAANTATGSFGTRGALQPSSLFNGVGVSAGTVYTVPNPATTDNRREFSANVPTDRVLEHSNSYSPTLIWHLPVADLKWIGAYTEYRFHSFSDTDAIARESFDYQPMTTSGTVAAPIYTPTVGISPVRIYTGSRFRFFEDKEYTSNELNLTSTGTGSLQWVLGLYQYHERYEQIPIGLETSNPDQAELHTVYQRPVAAITGTPAAQLAAYAAMTQVAYDNPTGATSSSTGISHASTYAAFGQADWKLNETWKLTLGGRLSRDEKEGLEKRFALIWDPSVVGAAAKAYDNSAAADCYTNGIDTYSSLTINRNYQRTTDLATGNEVAITPTSTSLTAFCRSRLIDKLVWSDWTGAAGIEWKPMDDLLTYAKYSRGYKSGAIRFGSFAVDAVTNPERLNAFELGIKTTIASKLQINGSVFYYDYNDYQFPVTETVDNGTGGSASIQTYTNLEKATSYGAELEVTWNPISTLGVWLTYSYLHTEIKSDLYLVDSNDLAGKLPGASQDRIIVLAVAGVPIIVGQNVKGNALPGSPSNKASANINYAFKFASGSLTPSVSYSWRDKQSTAGLSVSALSRDGNSTPSYGTADARITWSDVGGRYSIIASVANALNNETVNSASVDPTDSTRSIYNLNPPRTVYAEFQYRFGSEKR